MYISTHNSGSSLIANWIQDAQQVIQVPVMTLDQAIDRYGLPQFCKIDVEGYEMEVLRGLSHAIPFLTIRGFNPPMHRNLRASEGVKNLLR
jgi:FkbM family methyltransferase